MHQIIILYKLARVQRHLLWLGCYFINHLYIYLSHVNTVMRHDLIDVNIYDTYLKLIFINIHKSSI